MIIDAILEQSILHEVRAAHDAATFEAEMYVEDGTANWLVVRLEPADGSGAATIAGGYIDAESGDLKMPEGAETSVVKSGRWDRLDGAREVFGDDYHWLEPLEEGKRRLDPEDIYSPFVHGGILLFAPEWEAQGIEQFRAPVLMVEDWVAAVPDAIAAGPELVDAKADPSALERLRQSDNPLVTAWAWRHSLTLGATNLQAKLDTLSGPALAVRTRLLLDLGDDELSAEALHAIGVTSDLSRLEAMALGALSAAELPTTARSEAPQTVLKAIASGARSLDPGGEIAPKLRAILMIAGHADG